MLMIALLVLVPSAALALVLGMDRLETELLRAEVPVEAITQRAGERA